MRFETKLTRQDMLRCVLCRDAPCEQACPRAGLLHPAALLRSIWFADADAAAARMPDENYCAGCAAPCEKACVRPGEVPVRSLLSRLRNEVKPELEPSVSPRPELLRTELCGIPLENPFLLSSSVVSSSYDMCARAFEAGWAGAAFKTISSLEIHEASPRYSAITGDTGTIIGFKNIEQLSDHSIAENMSVFRRLKADYPGKLILASIMGQDETEWGSLARMCQENGADAVELNFSCPHMRGGSLGSPIGEVPELVERFTAAVKRSCSIPVVAKLTPNIARMSPAAEAAKRGGADGVSAINTIKSITGVNPHTFVAAPAVHGYSAVGGYSGSAVRPIALRFIAEIAKNPALDGICISAIGGIESWLDALEYILLGAGSVQITTAVMQYGYRIIDDLKAGLCYYMAEKGIRTLNEIRGAALSAVSESTDILEQDTVLYPEFHRDKCIGCGRCMISCADGGHQALRTGADRKPVLDGKRCVGCHLCVLVCPQRAIVPGPIRVPKKTQSPRP